MSAMPIIKVKQLDVGNSAIPKVKKEDVGVSAL